MPYEFQGLNRRGARAGFGADVGRLSRRGWLRTAAWGALAAGGLSTPRGSRGFEEGSGGRTGMIVRNLHPLDLESPVSALDGWLTPADSFFVRSHFGEPAVGLTPWVAEVGGLVERPLKLGERDWAGFEPRTVTAVLQCSGNGRGYFRPRIPGVGWERGAVGQAEWAGFRLADVLNRAGLKPGAAHVHFLGADGPPNPKTPVYLRSIPMEKALHPDTLLATGMNGGPLPALHGGPLRLIVPGWTGNHWMKWVRWVTVSAEEAPGFYMQTGYRLPRNPPPPGEAPKPGDLVPLTFMNVKSLITWPEAGARLPAGRYEARGVAWTGDGAVVKVELGLGSGESCAWAGARLVDAPRPWAWRRWRAPFQVREAGRYDLAARATDSQGHTQPEAPPYNKSGYLWNGFDRITVEV